MSIRIALFVLTAAAAISTSAAAQPTATPEGTVVSDRGGVEHTTTLFKTGGRLETVTCAQFNALDESFKPKAVTYAANYGPKGKAHPTETVAGVESLTPQIITECRALPGDHLLSHVRNAMKTAK